MRAGERVDITSCYGDGQPRRVADFSWSNTNIPRGCIAGYYPETNALVALSSFAIKARTPASKSIPVFLTRRNQEVVRDE